MTSIKIGGIPILSLERLQDLLAAKEIAECRDAIWQFFKRQGRALKVTLFALEHARAAVARKRARLQAFKCRLKTNCLVFIVEICGGTDIAPLSAWAETTSWWRL